MRSVAVLLTSVLATTVLAQEERPPHFAWPVGASAQVQVQVTGKQTLGEHSRSWDQKSSYTLTVLASGEELHVVRGPLAAWTGTRTDLNNSVDKIVDLIPVIRVTREGEFLGIDRAGEAVEQVRKVLAKDLPDAAVATMTSEAALRAVEQDFWNLLVDTWITMRPSSAEPTLLTHTTKVPQLGGGDLPLQLEVRRVNDVPCDPSDTARRCVEFRMVSRPDKPTVEKLLAGVDVSMTAFDLSQEMRVVTDPETLLPRKATFWRWAETQERGQTQVQTGESTRTYTFQWTLPGKKS